jgi:hypothetical protein
MKRCYVAILTTLMLSACSDATVDADGVPIVDIRGTVVVTGPPPPGSEMIFANPEPEKARMITLPDQSQITLSEFLDKYCLGKMQTNPTCIRGVSIFGYESGRNPRDDLPPDM